MYGSFPDAAQQIVQVLAEVKNLDLNKTSAIRNMIRRSLEVDTGRQLHRTDYLSPSRLREILCGKAFKTEEAVVQLIFPRTWKVIENL